MVMMVGLDNGLQYQLLKSDDYCCFDFVDDGLWLVVDDHDHDESNS